ncbi:MAG: tripartite tricarboxylate transporter TctB family protein [Granulosicoccus sp.]
MSNRGETIFVVVLIAFSATALWLAHGIAGFSKWSSPGVFPMLASATMLVCGLFILKDCLRNKKKAASLVQQDLTVQTHAAKADLAVKSNVPSSTTDSTCENGVLPKRVAILSILMVIYVAAMPTLGFLIDSGLFLFVSISYLWNRSAWMALLVSLLSLMIIHIVFRLAFQVILPQGTLIELLI